MGIIDKIIQKIKSFIDHYSSLDALRISLVIALISIAFFAGSLYERRVQKEGYIIHSVVQEDEGIAWEAYQIKKRDDLYFASRYGTKLYERGCKSRVSEKNKVFFLDLDTAYALGYEEEIVC